MSERNNSPTFTDTYNSFNPLQNRREKSLSKLEKIRNAFENNSFIANQPIAIFAAGSLGRLEYGIKSDLDIFIITQQKLKRLEEIRLFSILMDINHKLEFPDFSNDGQYLKVYDSDKLITATGSPKDDEENLFTARMLLLLESQPLYNNNLYMNQLNAIVDNYCRDGKGKKDFRPLFLLNDILRYWRTLCLNYEQIRNDINRPWRKKNINLKFSRMLTVFATVLPIIALRMNSKDDILSLCQKHPLHRLSFGLEHLDCNCLKEKYNAFLGHYEAFLAAKENNDEGNDNLKQSALDFSDFLHEALTHSRIDKTYRKYLVI